MKKFFAVIICALKGILTNHPHFYEIVEREEEYGCHKLKCMCCGEKSVSEGHYGGIGG